MSMDPPRPLGGTGCEVKFLSCLEGEAYVVAVPLAAAATVRACGVAMSVAAAVSIGALDIFKCVELSLSCCQVICQKKCMSNTRSI